MPATFAPITDRPKLFDDRPASRAHRPRRHPAAPPRDTTPAPPAPELIPRDPDPSARELPAREHDLVPHDADIAAHGPHDNAPAPREHDLAPHPARRGGGSLDDLIRGVWDDLSSHRTVSCPVCHGQMAPRYGSAEQPVGGRCVRCGSSLG
jgi:hypothetical protein